MRIWPQGVPANEQERVFPAPSITDLPLGRWRRVTIDPIGPSNSCDLNNRVRSVVAYPFCGARLKASETKQYSLLLTFGNSGARLDTRMGFPGDLDSAAKLYVSIGHLGSRS